MTNNKLTLLNNFINKKDPFNMLQYGESNIYIKEVKLLLESNLITPEKIKKVFNIGYKTDIDDNTALDIYLYIYKKIKI